MGICVEIMANDDGSFSVGQCEPDSENLQPVGDLKAALMQAAEMLQGAEAEGPEEPEAQQEAFQGGFDAVRGKGLGA